MTLNLSMDKAYWKQTNKQTNKQKTNKQTVNLTKMHFQNNLLRMNKTKSSLNLLQTSQLFGHICFPRSLQAFSLANRETRSLQ